MSKTDKHEPLSLSTPDSKGKIAPVGLKGRLFLHYRTRELYRVDGVLWFADTDEWSVVYRPANNGQQTFARTLSNFVETLEDGSRRFVEVSE